MNTNLYHIQVNVAPDNIPFYKDLTGLLGLSVIHEGDGMLGVAGPNGASAWFIGAANSATNDYDGPGMNHVGFHVDAQADVDTAVNFLNERGVPALFETPRHRPEFAQGPTQTYYQVMFESPDRVLFEVVYTGPKS